MHLKYTKSKPNSSIFPPGALSTQYSLFQHHVNIFQYEPHMKEHEATFACEDDF